MDMENSVRVPHDITFDVLHDGERQYEVKHGILFEFPNEEDVFIHLTPGNRIGFYKVMDVMLEIFEENGWQKDYTVWRMVNEATEEET